MQCDKKITERPARECFQLASWQSVYRLIGSRLRAALSASPRGADLLHERAVTIRAGSRLSAGLRDDRNKLHVYIDFDWLALGGIGSVDFELFAIREDLAVSGKTTVEAVDCFGDGPSSLPARRLRWRFSRRVGALRPRHNLMITQDGGRQALDGLGKQVAALG
jgi:hypothetical protein